MSATTHRRRRAGNKIRSSSSCSAPRSPKRRRGRDVRRPPVEPRPRDRRARGAPRPPRPSCSASPAGRGAPRVGNALLDRSGADVRFVPEEAATATAPEAVRQGCRAGRKPRRPRGGSNGLGRSATCARCAGRAARGARWAADAGAPAFDVVVHAGRAARPRGRPRRRHGRRARGPVLSPATTSHVHPRRRQARRQARPSPSCPPAPTTIDDRAREAGLRRDGRRAEARGGRAHGPRARPSTPAKALFGLREAVRRGRPRGARVLRAHGGSRALAQRRRTRRTAGRKSPAARAAVAAAAVVVVALVARLLTATAAGPRRRGARADTCSARRLRLGRAGEMKTRARERGPSAQPPACSCWRGSRRGRVGEGRVLVTARARRRWGARRGRATSCSAAARRVGHRRRAAGLRLVASAPPAVRRRRRSRAAEVAAGAPASPSAGSGSPTGGSRAVAARVAILFVSGTPSTATSPRSGVSGVARPAGSSADGAGALAAAAVTVALRLHAARAPSRVDSPP